MTAANRPEPPIASLPGFAGLAPIVFGLPSIVASGMLRAFGAGLLSPWVGAEREHGRIQ